MHRDIKVSLEKTVCKWDKCTLQNDQTLSGLPIMYCGVYYTLLSVGCISCMGLDEILTAWYSTVKSTTTTRIAT